MTNPAEDSGLVRGTVVAGKLRVIRLLGTGGMGAVYEVEHELTKHHRALKILHPRVAQSPTIVSRFLREASAAARIGNPHIAETFDAGRLESGEPYILMELLGGETLDGRVQRLGMLEPDDLADLVSQACDGVAAAHDAGIVHRDLKPENLFVTTKDGLPFVKVLDFGISKFDIERTGSMGATADGVLMGTPFYMSPEQVRGAGSVDHRADVYSLGVILYECASGVRPYDATAFGQIAILIHEGRARPLAERRPSLPPAFCEVVHRAMAGDREQRFPTARALADALAPFRAPAEAPPEVRTSSAPPRVVIHASSAPPAANPGFAMARTGSAMAQTTATGLADTMNTDPPAKPAGRSPALPFFGALTVLVAVGVTWTFVRASRSSGEAAATVAVTVVPEHAAASLAPSFTPPVEALVAGGAVDAALSQPAAPVHPLSPGTRPVLAVASSSAAPAAQPTTLPPIAPAPPPQKTRVDQNGLAGENPFR